MADETHQLYELKRVMPPPGDSAEIDFVQGVLRNVPLFKTEFLLTQLLSLNELSPKAIIFIIDFGTTAALADSRFHRPVSCLLRDLCARLSFRQCTSDFRSLVTRRCRWEFSDESKLASSLAPVRFSNICGFLAQLHSTALLTDRSLQDVLSVMAQKLLSPSNCMAAAERSGALGLLRALLRRTPATPPVAADLPFGARSDRPAAASRALFHAYRKAGRFYNELSRWNLLPADRALHESLLDVLTLMQERGWGVDPGKPQPTRPQQAHEQQGG